MPQALISSDRSISKAVSTANGARTRLLDGRGLYLVLNLRPETHGWRFDYSRPGGSGLRNTLSLGHYPETSLALARRKAEEARRKIAEGLDPGEVRKAQRLRAKAEAKRNNSDAQNDDKALAEGTFEYAARAFHAFKFPGSWSESYATKWLRMLEKHTFPFIGRRALRDITPRELLEVIQRIEKAGHLESSTCVREYAGQTFQYGTAHGWCEFNPAASLRHLVKKKHSTPYGAQIDKRGLAQLLVAINSYSGNVFTRVALQLQVMLFQRPGNLCACRLVSRCTR